MLRMSLWICLALLSAPGVAVMAAEPDPVEYYSGLQYRLFHYVAAGDLEAVGALLDQGADVNGRSPQGGQTPLMQAAGYALPEMIELLLDRGAEINGQADNGFGALHYAVLLGTKRDLPGSTEVVRVLLERGADADIGLGRVDTPLLRSVFYAEPEVWRLLLDHGATIDATNKYGLTPLHFAIRWGRREAVEYLVEAGAPLPDMFTAAGADDTERILELLAEGHGVNGYDWQGRSVLDWARGVNAQKAEALLVTLGAKTGAELQPEE